MNRIEFCAVCAQQYSKDACALTRREHPAELAEAIRKLASAISEIGVAIELQERRHRKLTGDKD